MRREIDRRGLLIGIGLLAGSMPSLGLEGPRAPRLGTHPAVAYLRTVAADLIAAQTSGNPADFFQAINRHADVPAIATYALGRYRYELPQSDQPRFYHGVAAFMARYFADQSRSYRIAKADIGTATNEANGEVLVKSTVTLTSGSSYRVTWRLVPTSGGFKVRDVTVLGFSLRHLQRSLFHSYMAKRGGLKALVAALTR